MQRGLGSRELEFNPIASRRSQSARPPRSRIRDFRSKTVSLAPDRAPAAPRIERA
jgi:hypothetical protein